MKFQKKTYFSYPCPRKLREIVKLSAFERETPETMKLIWNDYHSGKNNVFSLTLDGPKVDTMLTKYIFSIYI